MGGLLFAWLTTDALTWVLGYPHPLFAVATRGGRLLFARSRPMPWSGVLGTVPFAVATWGMLFAWTQDLRPTVVSVRLMIQTQVHLRLPCYDFCFL